MQKQNVPGLSLAIVQEGKMTRVRGAEELAGAATRQWDCPELSLPVCFRKRSVVANVTGEPDVKFPG